MKTQRILTIALLILVTIGMSYGQRLPKALEYNHNLIDAYCMLQLFEGDSSRFDPLSIKKCYEERHQTIIPSKKLDPDGLTHKDEEWTTGYHYTYQRKENQEYFSRFGPEECYVFWRYLGTLKDQYHIILVDNGCYSSTGRFSGINIIQVDEEIIQNIYEVAGGDRANEGVQEVHYKNNKLSYAQWHTPQHLFNLWLAQQGLNIHDLDLGAIKESSENLEKTLQLDDCAICGVAQVYFEIDACDLKTKRNEKITKKRITKVNFQSFAQRMREKADLSKDVTFKQCFDLVYNKYMNKKNLTINESELNIFFKKVIQLYKESEKED